MIRPATFADLKALLEIENNSFDYDLISPKSYRRFLGSDSSIVLVDEENGMIRGSVVLLFRSNSNRGRLYSIAVSPLFRGQGIGKQLLLAAIQETFQRRRLTLQLEVRESNVEAISMYRNYGFQVVGRMENYYDDGSSALRFSRPVADIHDQI